MCFTAAEFSVGAAEWKTYSHVYRPSVVFHLCSQQLLPAGGIFQSITDSSWWRFLLRLSQTDDSGRKVMSADGAAGTPSGDTLGFIHRENTHGKRGVFFCVFFFCFWLKQRLFVYISISLFVLGRGKVHFTPFLRGPSATGYTANQRPAVYYTPHLDHTDNPQLGSVFELTIIRRIV